MTEICNFQGTTLVTIRVVGESSRAPKTSLPWKRVAGSDVLEQKFGLVFYTTVRIVKIERIHHAQITIPQGAEERGRHFYRSVLGLTEIKKPASLRGRGGFWLQVGNQQVHVGTEDDVDRQATKAHLAYEVDDVEAWREKLLRQGVELLDSVPILGYKRFEFRDPFGNRIEFIQVLQ